EARPRARRGSQPSPGRRFPCDRRGASERRHARRAAAARARRRDLAPALLPGIEQPFDVAALLRREGNVGEEPADLGRVVVLDRRLEMLSHDHRLLELAAQPALEADLRAARHSGSVTVSVSPSSSTDPPRARTTRTATAAPRSRSSSPSTTGADDAVTGE